jgi:hypothetical protein
MSGKYVIKSIGSDGMKGNIRYWSHGSPPRSSYLVKFTVGEARSKKVDAEFSVLVSTPEGLRAMTDAGKLVIRDRATIVVADYDFGLIEAHLMSIVESCNRSEWSETVQELRRYFAWEWDGYKA